MSYTTLLYQGDCLAVMKEIESGTVDLTVTSPPYDNLRTYNGNNELWGEHVWKAVLADLYRVTKDGGVVVWVVGDATIKGSETGTSFRQALWAMECGFNLHDTMIYAKNNPIPQNHNRYEQCFEYMFVFSKGKPNTFNPLKEKAKNAGKEFDWGGRKTEMDKNQCRRHRDTEMIKTRKYKNRKNLFYYSVGGKRTGHPASFPEKLANDHIISWSNEGDTVFDPFMGSGTTGKMAKLMNRHFIGIELDEQYFKIAQARLHQCHDLGEI